MGKHDELLAGIRELIEPWLAELRRTITSSNTINERGAHRVTVPAVAGGAAAADVKASTVGNQLKGFNLRETTGAGIATVRILDGTDASADLVVAITLAANESVRDWFSERGIALLNGCYVQRVTGTVEGAVYLGGGGAT